MSARPDHPHVLLTPAFGWYIASSALWLAAMSLQGFLNTWLMIGELGVPADRFGLLHTVIAAPGVLLMLLGGVQADRTDPRHLLWLAHLLIAVPALLLAALVGAQQLALWMVLGYAVFGSALQSFADPARSAALSLVAAADLQRGVSLSMGISSGVGIAGFMLGSQLEVLGLPTVLVLQALTFVLGGLCMRRILPRPVAKRTVTSLPGRLRQIVSGAGVCVRHPMLRAVIGLNFVSAIFNAGGYIIVYPFIVRDVYAGGAALLALMMMVFMAAATSATLSLSLFMPLRFPGRLYVWLQLTRALILGLLWLQPPLWGLVALTFAWGANMGLTSTLSRAIIQAEAPPAALARVLAVFTATFMLTSLVSPLMLGYVVQWFGPLGALLPGIGTSVLIFVLALTITPLYGHEARGVPGPAPRAGL